MIKSKIHPWLASTSMTAMERKAGRFLRAPDGHDVGGGTDGVSLPTPAPTNVPASEVTPPAAPAEATAESLDAEFSSEPVDSATPKADEKTDPPTEEKLGASVQERIDQLTAKQRDAERDAAQARRELAETNAKLDALTLKTDVDGGNVVDPDQAPDPDNYEFGEVDAKFTADNARFHARAEYKQMQEAAELKTKFANLEVEWQGKVALPDVIEKYPDFAVKVNATEDWDCSPLMAIGIKQSSVGTDVAYHLATNPVDASRIAKLTPVEQALEFGRIEGRFMHEASLKAAIPKTVSTTQAPTPPEGRARGAGGKFSTAADTEDFSAFDKMADGMLNS